MEFDSDDEISDFSGQDFSDADEEPDNQPQHAKDAGQKGFRHLEELRSTLGLDQYKDKSEMKREKRRRQKEKRRQNKLAEAASDSGPSKRIETLATKLNATAAKIVPEVIVYQDPRKRPKAASKNSDTSQKSRKLKDDNDTTLTMKQARFDVFKFGIRGLDKEGQHEARVALALRLGAKPEKKKCLPYDQFKEQARARKEELAKEKELAKITGMQKVSARPLSAKKKSKADAKSSEKTDGKKKKKKRTNEGVPLKMGKFDGGTLRLSKKDLSSLKSTKK